MAFIIPAILSFMRKPVVKTKDWTVLAFKQGIPAINIVTPLRKMLCGY
jgi:hypothetical protein